MNYSHTTGLDLPAVVLTTGVVVSPRTGDPATKGVTLASGTTYVFALGGESSPLESIHIVWDAAIIVTFTIEDSNMPSGLGGPGGPADVSNFDSVAGNWIQENPTTGYVAVGPPSTGVTVTNLTIAVAGGTATGAIVHMGNFGSRRSRLKATVGGTGGVVRVLPHGKA
jgi:hypothetical protein